MLWLAEAGCWLELASAALEKLVIGKEPLLRLLALPSDSLAPAVELFRVASALLLLEPGAKLDSSIIRRLAVGSATSSSASSLSAPSACSPRGLYLPAWLDVLVGQSCTPPDNAYSTNKTKAKNRRLEPLEEPPSSLLVARAAPHPGESAAGEAAGRAGSAAGSWVTRETAAAGSASIFFGASWLAAGAAGVLWGCG